MGFGFQGIGEIQFANTKVIEIAGLIFARIKH
jgi:hypothetical protein